MPINNYEIASGFDQSGSTTNIESISVTGATPIKSLVGFKYNDSASLGASTHFLVLQGLYQTTRPYVRNARGGLSQIGYITQTWVSPVMTVKAYEYLVTNFIENATYQNACTIRTAFGTGSYAKYNAVLSLPPLSEFVTQEGLFIECDGVAVLQSVIWTWLIKGVAS